MEYSTRLVVFHFFLTSVSLSLYSTAEARLRVNERLREPGPFCVICTDEHDCQSDTCKPTLDRSHLVPLSINITCPQVSEAVIIPPTPHDAVSLDEAKMTCRGYKVVYTDPGCLEEIPTNLCHFPAIKVLDLKNQRLTVFPNLSCLTELAILDLRHNIIKNVPRSAFVGLTNIIEIYLDNNKITSMDVFAFEPPMPKLNIFSLSCNALDICEMWPLKIHHEFCIFDLSQNHITEITNENKFNISAMTDMSIGPGMVNFSYNLMSVFPTTYVKQFGINNIWGLSVFLKWGFDFRGNPMNCDCSLYELLSKVQFIIKLMFREYFKVKCYNPEYLRGKLIIEVPLDQFVCNVTLGCPKACWCQYRPAFGYLYVDCTSARLKVLPLEMPADYLLNLILANNSISTLDTRAYLKRVQFLDLRCSGLKSIAYDVPSMLKKIKILDIRDNDIQYLPDSLQLLSPKTVLLDWNTLRCNCSMTWFAEWQKYAKTNSLSSGTEIFSTTTSHFSLRHLSIVSEIFCRKDNGDLILMSQATSTELSCFNQELSIKVKFLFGILTAFIVVLVISVVVFRFELLVVYHWCLFKGRELFTKKHSYSEDDNDSEISILLNPSTVKQESQYESGELYNYDVFISAETDSDNDLKWLQNILLPEFEKRDIKGYLPLRDSPIGCVVVDEMVTRMKESCTILIVLSTAYVAKQACLFQFSRGYNLTHGPTLTLDERKTRNGRQRLIVVLIDSELQSKSINEPRLKAMMRLNMVYLAWNAAHMTKLLTSIQEVT